MTDEVSLGLTHAFANNVAISGTVIYRNTTDLLEHAHADLRRDRASRRVATRDDYEFSRTREGTLPDGRDGRPSTSSTCAKA